MRYILRNQDKIAASIGEDLLKRIVKSLEAEFNGRENHDIKTIEGEKLPLLLINDAGHSFNMITFYVVNETFDVYLLAFNEFIG